MVDAQGSGPCGGFTVLVRIQSSAPYFLNQHERDAMVTIFFSLILLLSYSVDTWCMESNARTHGMSGAADLKELQNLPSDMQEFSLLCNQLGVQATSEPLFYRTGRFVWEYAYPQFQKSEKTVASNQQKNKRRTSIELGFEGWRAVCEEEEHLAILRFKQGAADDEIQEEYCLAFDRKKPVQITQEETKELFSMATLFSKKGYMEQFKTKNSIISLAKDVAFHKNQNSAS